MDQTNEKMNVTDFDLENWRKENPMDYFKALELLAIATNKEEVFKWIYEASRYRIPQILYKYYSLNQGEEDKNEQKLMTLEQAKVYLSDIENLNDPFDNKAYFYRAEVLEKYDRLKHCKGRVIDRFDKYFRLASLTENGINSMPMWAHYAANHAGFCVAYDMNCKENFFLKAATFPVQYMSRRIDVTNIMDYQMGKIIEEVEAGIAQKRKRLLHDDSILVYMPMLLCNLKHESWSYEKEFRCTLPKAEPSFRYCQAMPKEIYIGAKCSAENRERLICIGKKLSVPVYRMKYDDYSADYSLLAEKVEM